MGLQFFPFDVCQDNKMELIEAEFGLNGFAIIVKLWQKIYGEQGYYCEFDDEVALVFARKCGASANVVSEIVGAAIRRGIFNKELYEKYSILTSHGIQSRYIKATNRRVRVDIEKQYLLLSLHEIKGNVYIIEKNVYRNSKNADIQDVKKEINKRNKRKRERKDEPAVLTRHKYGRYENVLLSDEDMEMLKNEFPHDWQNRIERLSEYMASSGRQYKNHLATIRTWAREDKKADKQKNAASVRSKFNNYTDSNGTDYASLERELMERISKNEGDKR